MTDDFTGAFVRLDEQGRVAVDYDALRSKLQSDLDLSSDAAVTAAQLAGSYLRVGSGGSLDVDYNALVAALELRAMAFEDDAPSDGTPYERQNGAWVAAGVGGGGVSDGDKGDITVSGSGATWTIDNDAVTFAKMQNLTAARLMGRRSGSSGDPEEITPGAGLSISSGALLNASVTGISVNGASSADVDFTDATPAASAGRANVAWGTSGVGPTSVSASVPQGPTLFKVLDANAAATNGTSAQNWFPSAGAVTVTVNRAYFFEGLLLLSKSTTSTSVGVSLAGSASYTSRWWQMGQSIAVNTANATQQSAARTTNSNVLAAPASTAANAWVYVWGTIRVTGAGTFAPQFTFSAAPGSPNVLAGTCMRLTEIGADTVTTRGTWS